MKPSKTKRFLPKPAALVFSVALFGTCSTTLFAAGDETYQLAKKWHVPAVGTVGTSESTMTMKDAPTTISGKGMRIEGTTSSLANKREVSEILSPTKVRITTQRSEIRRVMTVNGKERENPKKPHALLNKPFILEFKDGKWVASLEGGGEPTAEQENELKRRAEILNQDPDFEMYGDTPRKVGDEWKADPSQIGLGEGTDMKGDYTVKFVEIKEVGGIKCAVLKANYDIKGKLPPGAGGLSTLTMKGETVSIRSIEDMADMEIRINATLTMDISDSEGITAHIAGLSETIQKNSIKKP